MGDLSAKHACEDLKIQGHKDHVKLNQAKDLCYQKGFAEGRCIVGVGKGMMVEEAKPVVKKMMCDEGTAFLYFEPEKEILSRTGDSCIVALVDQYLLQYGEESWKEKVKAHVQSEDFQTYNPKT
jgi:leucyl-tRNA synthetase